MVFIKRVSPNILISIVLSTVLVSLIIPLQFEGYIKNVLWSMAIYGGYIAPAVIVCGTIGALLVEKVIKIKGKIISIPVYILLAILIVYIVSIIPSFAGLDFMYFVVAAFTALVYSVVEYFFERYQPM